MPRLIHSSERSVHDAAPSSLLIRHAAFRVGALPILRATCNPARVATFTNASGCASGFKGCSAAAPFRFGGCYPWRVIAGDVAETRRKLADECEQFKT